MNIKGPYSYVKFPLIRKDTGRTVVLHLFSDVHRRMTTCKEDSIFLHELIDRTLEKHKEDGVKIDIFAEYGFGQTLYDTKQKKLDTTQYISLFNSYYLSQECLYRPRHPQCQIHYPNARFHNGDFRSTLCT